MATIFDTFILDYNLTEPDNNLPEPDYNLPEPDYNHTEPDFLTAVVKIPEGVVIGFHIFAWAPN